MLYGVNAEIKPLKKISDVKFQNYQIYRLKGP